MADFKSIREIVNQVTVQAATVVMIVFRDTETGPQRATAPNQQERQRKRHRGPILERPNSTGRCIQVCQLLTFEVEVTNILETKAYEICGEEKGPVIKIWPGQEGLLLIETFT